MIVLMIFFFLLAITFCTLWSTRPVTGNHINLVTINYPSDPCEDDWIWSKKKCYYFSSNISEWQTGQDFCASRNASLALLDSIDELNFLVRFKGSSDHWIGLSREQEGRPWVWTNGTLCTNATVKSMVSFKSTTRSTKKNKPSHGHKNVMALGRRGAKKMKAQKRNRKWPGGSTFMEYRSVYS
ncbi:uncharacterized protein LOC143769568 isoform X4 [Ranitomeya variabilis]